MQRRIAFIVCSIDFRPGVEQRLDHVLTVAGDCRNVQRCVAGIVPNIGARPRIEQRFHHGQIPIVRRIHKRCVTAEIPCVNNCLGVEKR